jgi:hypothetical protein
MLNKIIRNLVDIRRLHRVMRVVPISTATRYHRWSREDVENLDGAQTALLIEMGRLHRGDTVPFDSALNQIRDVGSILDRKRGVGRS